MPTLGIIGSGNIGAAIARLEVAAGIPVVVANSRGPQSLAGLIAELGPLATAGRIVASGYRRTINHASRHMSRAAIGSPPAARWLCACFCSISRVILLLVCSPGLSCSRRHSITRRH